MNLIDAARFTPERLSHEPYRWGFVDQLFTADGARELVESFPRDYFKTVKGYDGEKGYEYEARSLVHMGASVATQGESLSPAWQNLAADLLSPVYRAVVSRFTGVDVSSLPMEANAFHYGRSAWLGPHVDLEDKLVTHVLYFNDSWNESDGGCLTILGAGDMDHIVKTILPIIGNSAVLVRSTNSWHAVTRVRETCRISRRSVAVTFYRPGSP
ncbi:MAG TPA: 2OG-Fe(II) oxygenase, partial [Pyrinomonadaceae bacterium]|nr:2OG-Fe(II) oxygenase [Pyrinomonadaceae bacterium]